TMATAPSVLTSLRARSTPTEGLVAESSVTTWIIGPPKTAVAAALSSSAASSTPLLMAGPNSANAPVYDISVPTVETGGASSCAKANPMQAINANVQTTLFIDVFSS